MPTNFIPVPDWPYTENQGAGIALVDLDNSGRPDLIVCQIDNPPGANVGLYRVGKNLDINGNVTGGWGPWVAIPDWPFVDNQGLDIAVADLDGNGRPDLIVFQIDSPPGPNQGLFRVGRNLDVNGIVTGGWSPWMAVPDWPYADNQGAGIAVTNLDNAGGPDLIIFQIDNAPGANTAYYRIGRSLNINGTVTGGWGPWIAIPDSGFFENQGGAITTADLDGNGRPDLIVFSVDNPAGPNAGLFRVGRNLDINGNVTGGWTAWMQVPDWNSPENQGLGIAVTDLSGKGQTDLFVFKIDNPPGANQGLYCIGRGLDINANITGGWSDQLVPDWPYVENDGAGVVTVDLDNSGRPDLIVFQIDGPPGPNAGLYRIGRNLDQAGKVTGGWGPWVAVPDWPFNDNQDGAIAVTDLEGNGRPDLIVFQIDNPVGANAGLYRIGRNLDANGNVTGGWTPWTAVPDWPFAENQGAGIAVADLDGNGRPDLIVFHIDNPPGENIGLYRIGRNLDVNGNVTGGWSPWMQVPDWGSFEDQGAGIAVGDLDGDGRPELILIKVDNPAGANQTSYRVGWTLDPQGKVKDGWGEWIAIPNWGAAENQGVDIAVTNLDNVGKPELIAFKIDSVVGANQGRYRVLSVPIAEEAEAKGVWGQLPYNSPFLTISAALLHTNKILIFTGSSNIAANGGNPAMYRGAVWDYETGVIREIGTPVDMFCAGHAFLQDGRLLVAGGNKQYPGPTGPFQGLRDAFVFDPITEQWRRVATMAGGRWYPTLVTLPDGRIITFTGVRDNADEPFGADDLNNIPEIYAEPNGEPGNWTALPNRDIYPMYSHIFLMQDGRLFYSGGYQGFNTLSPRIYNYNTNTTQLVPGLRNVNTRGEPISVMLPPVQDQRVLVAGGGDPTTNATDIINLKAANPAYAPAAPINYARMHGLGVVLPDRTVLICGGSQIPQDPATATLYSEIFNPVTNTWSIAAKNFWPRLYHTVALLLPDGRVVLSGGNPPGYQELRLEVYRPPYMFKPNRPTYGAAFQNTLTYGSIIGIPTPQSQQIQYVSLLKPMANTHTLETGQRLIDLQIVSRATPGYIHAQLANDRNLTPPGWYMLFIVDNRGVPSMGHWLRVF